MTTTTTAGQHRIAKTAGARLRWAWADGLTLTGRNLQHVVREPGEAILGMAVPLMMVAVFGYVFGNAMAVGNVDYVQYFVPGIFVMAVVMSIGGTASAVALDVERGVVDRFRSMPVARSALLTGRAAADMIRAAPELAIMVGAGLLIGWRWHDGMTNMLLALGLILLLRFALEWVGIFLGLVVPSPDVAGMAVYPLVFPLTAVSAALVPTETMPGWLGTIAEWNPLSATVIAARELLGLGGAAAGGSWATDHALLLAVAWPLALVAIFMPLAILRYRRLSR